MYPLLSGMTEALYGADRGQKYKMARQSYFSYPSFFPSAASVGRTGTRGSAVLVLPSTHGLQKPAVQGILAKLDSVRVQRQVAGDGHGILGISRSLRLQLFSFLLLQSKRGLTCSPAIKDVAHKGSHVLACLSMMGFWLTPTLFPA